MTAPMSILMIIAAFTIACVVIMSTGAILFVFVRACTVFLRLYEAKVNHDHTVSFINLLHDGNLKRMRDTFTSVIDYIGKTPVGTILMAQLNAVVPADVATVHA